MKQGFIFISAALVLFGCGSLSVHSQESCADEASVQRVEADIAETQHQAKARERVQQAELKALLDRETQKKQWSPAQVEQLFANMLKDEQFSQLEAQKKPYTSDLIRMIRTLRSSKAGARDLAAECQQAQQITAILHNIIQVNQQQYEWMRRDNEQSP